MKTALIHRVVGRWLIALSIALVAALRVRATPDLYYAAAAGATSVQWSSRHPGSVLPRTDARIGWQAAEWISLEVSVFATGTATNFDWTAPFNTPRGIRYPWGVTLRRRLDGFTAGPVLSVPISHRLRLFTRQQLLLSTTRTRVEARPQDPQWAAVMGEPIPSFKSYRTTDRETGYQGGLGIAWQFPRDRRWEIAVEAVHARTTGDKTRSLLASATYRPRVAVSRHEPAPLYVAGGGGIAWLKWEGGDPVSRVSRQHAAIGCQITRWAAVEIAYAHFGRTRNTRLYRSIPDAIIVTPVGSDPVVWVPAPLREYPYPITRQLESMGAGVVFKIPVTDAVSLVSRHHAARVTESHFGDLRGVPYWWWPTYELEYRTWRYQPGVGVTWNPRSFRQFNLTVEVMDASSRRVRGVGAAAAASIMF